MGGGWRRAGRGREGEGAGVRKSVYAQGVGVGATRAGRVADLRSGKVHRRREGGNAGGWSGRVGGGRAGGWMGGGGCVGVGGGLSTGEGVTSDLFPRAGGRVRQAAARLGRYQPLCSATCPALPVQCRPALTSSWSLSNADDALTSSWSTEAST